MSWYAASTRLRLTDSECEQEAWNVSAQFVLGAPCTGLNALKIFARRLCHHSSQLDNNYSRYFFFS